MTAASHHGPDCNVSYCQGACNERPAATVERRHPATEKAWAWLDSPEGIARLSPEKRAHIENCLRDIDAIFNEWDAEVFA